MLMQIPNVSHQSATAILNKFKTLKDLTIALESDAQCLDSSNLKTQIEKFQKMLFKI